MPPDGGVTGNAVGIKIAVLSEAGAQLPSYQTEGSSGADLVAHLDSPVVLPPGARAMVGTGLRLAIPEGYEAQVRPRSGLAAKHGITVLNTPGTIDSDYRGEVKVILINLGDTEFAVQHGDRIAQLIVAPVHQAVFEKVPSLEPSRRGEGGFGSTGG